MCQARSWQANVAKDQLTLLSGPSAQGRVVTTPPLGENVGILLKLRILDEDWCKVRVLATLSVVYVRCDALNLEKVSVRINSFPSRQVRLSLLLCLRLWRLRQVRLLALRV